MESFVIKLYKADWRRIYNMSYIFMCTGALRALRCNQMEGYPMSIDENLAWHCAIRAHCTQALVQQYKHGRELCVCESIFSFFSNQHPSVFRHHFYFLVYFCARACIWHLSGGLRVMPWSCHKLGHCFMCAVRCPMWETASLRMSIRATGNNAATGFFALTYVCPKTNKLSSFPCTAHV